ncbi:2-oxoglutarate and Fe(II)-dependent oxygenase superfamily protein [Tripterygium wilfordii]|uniref:2-oxoglutarate and Fe(II)-dependent oxygenase superfamily protein n=1 Tax=Tripterygium wilfordii TaxID=458696 RepID=A0A7J7BXX8_TRIWF|nr:protein DOWNY MILDEW RESISTANCE 6-like [Tripterygium wilfordii]KAF5726721.1 2-oxoglutarate and Fe(II)-dependent oxygenase superfamily protein [Tripterygium wilfordii]
MESTSFQLSTKFILPEDKRPQLSKASTLHTIPIIDMNQEPSLLVQNLSQACEEYGFFQIINHGVPNELCQKMMTTLSEFFALSSQEKAQFFTTDLTKQVKLFNYYLKLDTQEKVTMWSESFAHPWHPLEDIIHLLPENPLQYREVFAAYAKEMRVLMRKLLRFVSQGLGLEMDCLEKILGLEPALNYQANHYPPCPDPELTLGLPAHTDIVALTILLQSEGVTGLQVIKDGNWVSVDPVPNAFVINLGDQIQVLSNGRYKSVHHRAMTNNRQSRISVAMFYRPNSDVVIGPIEDMIDDEHPPLYRNYYIWEFMEEFRRQEGTRRRVKETFELRH